MPAWEVVILFGGFIAFIGLVFGPLMLRLTLDRRVRKQLLPADKVYNDSFDSYGGLLRASLFGFACLFDRLNRHPAMLYSYNRIYLKGFANWFETLLAVWHVGGLALLLAGGIIIQLYEWFV
ncbi:hypothetical protein [Oceanobacter mangrovi]|uniref:hypothetical protein n=1 Tax=Oceanobacter mangrovi TaxID=2862510 RepID=UPI001C8DE367|nr:hypothetical protein [Oceanobacter mangrovi]